VPTEKQKKLSREQRMARLRRKLADMLARDGHLRQAIHQYELAAAFEEDDPDFNVCLGDAYSAEDLPQQAYERYVKALRLNPRHADTHFSMAQLFLSLGKVRAAIKALQRAVENAPDRDYYIYRLGALYFAAGDLTLAEVNFRRALELKPNDAFYRYKLGEAFFAQKLWDKAVSQYEKAIELAPLDDFYHVRLAAAYVRLGRYADALAAFERACELDRTNAAYPWIAGYLLMRLGREKEARERMKLAGDLGEYELDYVRRWQVRCGAETV